MAGPKTIKIEERVLAVSALILASGSMCVSLFLFGRDEPHAGGWLAFTCALALIVLAVPGLDSRWSKAFHKTANGSHATISRQTVIALILLCAILLLALAVRLVNISNLPPGLWYDEAINLWDARHISENLSSTPVFVRVNPVIYLLPVSGLIHFFGAIPETVRLVSIGFSIAGLLATFLFARHLIGTLGATLPAFIVAVSRWDINFSRVGMIPITVPFLAALVAYLTLRAVRGRRDSDFGMAGFALGLGAWFYSGFYLFSIVIGFMLLHYLLVQRPAIKEWTRQCGLMVTVAVIVASPLIQFAITDSEVFFSRSEQTSIFTNNSSASVSSDLFSNLQSHLLMFHVEGDDNPRHNLPGRPMLDVVSGGLLIVGLVMATRRWRQLPFAVLPVWLFVMLLPGILTHQSEAPQALRSIGVLPAVAVLVALPLTELWKRGIRSRDIRLKRIVAVVVVLFAALISYLNIDAYFGEQAQDPRVFAAFSTDETLIGRHMAERQSLGYSLMATPSFEHSLQIHFAGNDPEFQVVRDPLDTLIDSMGIQQGVSLFISSIDSDLFQLIKKYYPDGRFETIRPPGGGDPLYFFAEMTRKQVESRQGLQAEYIRADGEVVFDAIESPQAVWQVEAGAIGSIQEFSWRGRVRFSESGEYLFELVDDNSTRVYLDGQLILHEGARSAIIHPVIGLQDFEVVGMNPDMRGSTTVLWKPPGHELEPIPFGNLFRVTDRP